MGYLNARGLKEGRFRYNQLNDVVSDGCERKFHDNSCYEHQTFYDALRIVIWGDLW
jgi:hypothetical protein